MLQLRQGSDFENGKAATSRALSPFLELCWFVWRREAICRSVGLVRLATCKLRGVECPCLSNSQFWRHDNHCRAPIGVPIYPIWGSHVKNEMRAFPSIAFFSTSRRFRRVLFEVKCRTCSHCQISQASSTRRSRHGREQRQRGRRLGKFLVSRCSLCFLWCS